MALPELTSVQLVKAILKGYDITITPYGDRHWYLNGKRHREDGPAVEYADGDRVWYLNGKLHREDGPAVEHSNGDREWYLNGKLHREDGPAVEYADGDRVWFLNGEEMTEEEFNQITGNS